MIHDVFILRPMAEPIQQFGGKWTDQKLQRLRDYLVAYQEALKNQPYTLYYIDAFAGTGYNTPKAEPEYSSPLFDDLVRPDTREFVDGSARIALQIPRPFDHYVFVERDPSRHAAQAGMRNCANSKLTSRNLLLASSRSTMNQITIWSRSARAWTGFDPVVAPWFSLIHSGCKSLGRRPVRSRKRRRLTCGYCFRLASR